MRERRFNQRKFIYWKFVLVLPALTLLAISTKHLSVIQRAELPRTTNSLTKFNDSEIMTATHIHHESGFVFIMFVDEAFLKMTLSWICHAPNSVLAKTLFIVSSPDVQTSLKQFGAQHFKIISMQSSKGRKKKSKIKYGQKAYYEVINLRARLVSQLLHRQLSVWIIESDSTWLADPTSVLERFQNQDIVAGKDGEDQDEFPEAGFVFLNSTSRTRKLWDGMVTWQRNAIDSMTRENAGDAGNEMLQLPEMLMQTNCTWSYFPASHFVSGKWYVSEKIRSSSSPIVIQNNWIVGTKHKIHRAQRWGHWYLHPSGHSCLLYRGS